MTTIIAIYAALISTFTLVWNISRSSRRLKVSVVLSINTNKEGKAEFGYNLVSANHSASSVQIRSIMILWPYKRATASDRIRHVFQFRKLPIRIGWCYGRLPEEVESDLPFDVEPGRSHIVFLDKEMIHNKLNEEKTSKFIACAQDALGRNFYSRAFELPNFKT